MDRSVPFESHHQEFLRDPERTNAYLSVALEEYENDKNSDAFLLALRDVAQVLGGLGKLAEQTELNRGRVYRALSEDGNPNLDKIEKILHSLGFRLSIERLLVPE
ncbi:MAG: transcriptional regulator [Gemmatimonadetes bacterium]|nr:transcriptional regulator [Gemmatimonadota bacterium]